MHRREFLRFLVDGACTVALGSWRARSAFAETAGAVVTSASPSASTVAIKRFGEEKEAVAAVDAALGMLGGIDKIVKPGDTVMVKPNLVIASAGRWIGRVTNSKVMDGVLKAVIDAGGVPIVAEGSCEKSFGGTAGFAEKTGLMEVCRRYDAKFVDLNEDEVVKAKVPDPLLWSEFPLARQIFECDKFISVPVMKIHRATGVTLGMKNLVGTISPRIDQPDGRRALNFHDMEQELWRRRYGGDMSGENELLYWTPLGATIADLVSVRHIDLVVVDGTFGDERNAPDGGLVDIKERSGSYLVMAGADTVAVDSVGAHIMGQIPDRLQQLRFAAAKGLGTTHIDKIGVVGEQLEDVSVPMRGYIL